MPRFPRRSHVYPVGACRWDLLLHTSSFQHDREQLQSPAYRVRLGVYLNIHPRADASLCVSNHTSGATHCFTFEQIFDEQGGTSNNSPYKVTSIRYVGIAPPAVLKFAPLLPPPPAPSWFSGARGVDVARVLRTWLSTGRAAA